MQDFRKLLVWQKAHEAALLVYDLTSRFPKSELYGLTSQLRRAAVSVAANLAEGSKRSTPADFARFISISEGSAAEAQYVVILSGALGYLDDAQSTKAEALFVEILKMLYSLRVAVLRRPRQVRPAPEDEADVVASFEAADRGEVLSAEDSEAVLRWYENGCVGPCPVKS